MPERRCTECGETKPLTEFDLAAAGKPRRRTICRPCDLERKRIWYQDNRDRINAERRWKTSKKRREAAYARS